MSSAGSFRNAAERLEGKSLPGGWKVLSKLHRHPGDTGGNFSVNYLVENDDGREGFCKVLNYSWVVQAQAMGLDPVEAMANAMAVYRFERDLTRRCAGLSRVVTALDDGSMTLPGYEQNVVSFIVFERAEGDIRRILNVEDRVEISTRLRILHNMAAGLRQLHAAHVAHQDVKPSNALVFPGAAGSRHAKLGDLGRATDRNSPSPHDDFAIAGDPNYAPPEALYGAVPTEFGARRLACDLYQLGSMVSFVFTAATLNALLHRELHPSHSWSNWQGSYRDVLPYVRDAFGRAVEKVGSSSPEAIAERAMRLTRWLGDPDPLLRGHPAERQVGGNIYRLDRVVSELDLLASRASWRARQP
jgi:eukaryotic-like serine/threonine-protein kinase